MILHAWSHVGTPAFPQEVRLNFDTLPAVIGVHGGNGQGKTTLLDTIVAGFYLQMPFRPGPLHDHFAKRGYIDLVWSLEPSGRRYRSRVNVDPGAKRTEAVLYPAEGGSALAGPLQRDYLKEIVRLLGPLDLFLCSAYTVQPSYTTGKNTFTFLLADRAERRGIMAELLGLNEYGMKAAGARDQVKSTETQLAGVQALVKQWEKELAVRPEAEGQVAAVADRAATAAGTLTAAQTALQRAQERLQGLQMTRAGLLPYQAQRNGLIKTIGDHRTQLDRTLSAHRTTEEALTLALAAKGQVEVLEQVKARMAELAPIEAAAKAAEAEILALETELEGILEKQSADQAILSRAETILDAVRDLVTCDERIADNESALQAALAADADAASAYKDWAGARDELRHKTMMLEQIREAISIEETVPCGGKGEFAACRFLVNAAAARTRLHGAEDSVQRLEAVVGDHRSEPVATAPGILAHLNTLKAQRAEFAAVAAQERDLAAAEARQHELNERYRAIVSTLADRRHTLLEHKDQLAELPTQRKLLEMFEPKIPIARTFEAHQATAAAQVQRIEEFRRAIAETEKDIAALTEHTEALKAIEVDLIGANADVMRTSDEVRAAQTTVNAAQKDVQTAELRLRMLDEAAKRLRDAKEQIGPLERDLADWTLLARAFSPAGIPALLVDKSLPEISATASDLLRDCFGESLFTIQLTTQRESKDEKKLLEVLDVVVYRDGVVLPVEELSGGEGVLVSEALALAIAYFNARRDSTRKWPRTLFRDEVGANLDARRAPAYTRLLARAVKLGQFDRVLFVSHHPAALEVADARIEVQGGTLTLS